MILTESVFNKTAKLINKDNYKTTSFTLLKEDYSDFVKVCSKLNKTPSAVLRALIQTLIEENKGA